MTEKYAVCIRKDGALHHCYRGTLARMRQLAQLDTHLAITLYHPDMKPYTSEIAKARGVEAFQDKKVVQAVDGGAIDLQAGFSAMGKPGRKWTVDVAGKRARTFKNALKAVAYSLANSGRIRGIATEAVEGP